MNTSTAHDTAQAFRVNFADLLTESTEYHLPEGLADLLLKVREFATEAGELDMDRPDSTTAFFQNDMNKVWTHAFRALADTRIVGSKTTGQRDYSFGADRDRERRRNIIWHLKWIEAILHAVTH